MPQRKPWTELSPAYRRRLAIQGITEQNYSISGGWVGDVNSAYPPEAVTWAPGHDAPDLQSFASNGSDFPCCDQRFPAEGTFPTTFDTADLYAFNRLIHKLDQAGYTVAAGRMRDVRDIHFGEDGQPCTRPTPGHRA